MDSHSFICCVYQKSDSHDQNNEIINSPNFYGTTCEEHVQNQETTVGKIVNILV